MGPWGCGSQTDGFIRRNGADDEGAGSDFEGDGRQAQVVGSSRNYRHLRPVDEAVAGALPGVWLRRAVRSAERAAESQAGAAEDRRGSAAAISGEVLRFQRAALPREVSGRARHRAELYMGEDGAARLGAGGQAAAAGKAS